jgi:SnoaL-like domain
MRGIGVMVRLTAAAVFSGAAMVSASPDARAEALSAADQVAITQAVTGLGLYADVRDWQRVSLLMADQVTTDYTDVFGGQIVTTSREDLVEQWRTTFQGFDATQHQITNVSVSGGGDEASTLSHVRAIHWVDGRSWTIGGVYTHRLERGPNGWQIAFMAIQRLYEEGDRGVFDAASRR